MSQDLAFVRKVIYIAIVVVLLIPLYFLGRPAPRGNPEAGGELATQRHRYGLSQTDLGEIDPASESMKLAALGLRGVAANLLWTKANEYKKVEDWDGLTVTLNQITKLQPNFISVWEFQAHNLSYNVSAEFDNYRQRYHWVKKGINFLQDGIAHNRNNPRLLHQTGWYVGQKIGRADEHVYFRRMFREDKDFHDELNRGVAVDDAKGYDGRPDHWLVGQLWYHRAYEAVDGGVPLKGKSPLVFRTDGPMSLVNYAADIEEEGILGDIAQRAWQRATKGWGEFGRIPIPTSWGHNIRLGDLRSGREAVEVARKAFDELTGNLREQIRQEKIAKLSEAERKALAVPVEKLDDTNARPHYEAEQKTAVEHREVADRAPANIRPQALASAARLIDREALLSRVQHYRSIVNYDYWEIRCAAEQTKTMVDARGSLYEARKAHEAAELDKARKLYEQSWDQWATVFRDYPRLDDGITAEDMKDSLRRYRRLLQQLDEELPEKFPLRDMLKKLDEKEGATSPLGTPAGQSKSAATPGELPKTPPPPAKAPAPEKVEKPAAKTEKPAAKTEKPAAKTEKPAAGKPAS